MAFQAAHARRKPPVASQVPSSASHDRLSVLSDGGSSEGEGVLLFGAPASLADSTWTTIASPPRARPQRLSSYASSSNFDSSQEGGNSPLISGSLLPAHDGNGVFALGAESLRETSSSEGGEEDASDRRRGQLAPRRHRRLSHATTDTSHSTTASTTSSFDAVSLDGAHSWALTEAALSTIPHATRRPSPAVPVAADAQAESSVAYTSGSDDDDRSDVHASRGGGSARRARRANFDDELGQSLSALSAGITSHRRRGESSSISASRSPSNRNRLALAPVVGSVVPRSLSPYSPSALSHTSSEGAFSIGSNGQRRPSKRRHRKAAGREGGAAGSVGTKRLEMSRFERIEAEERSRAERIKSVLHERIQQNRIDAAKGQIFMGDFASKVMNLDATTFPVLASDDPTPTPSRASSPPPALAHKARLELAHWALDSIGETYVQAAHLDLALEEEEGNATETEEEARSSNTASRSSQWVQSPAPPVFAPRLSSPPLVSRTAINTSFTTPFSTRQRSASTTSTHSSPVSTTVPLPLSRSLSMTHEERIMLSTPSITAPWGGEIDSSFQLAMNYWKKLLRRLTNQRSVPSTPTSNHSGSSTTYFERRAGGSEIEAC